LTLLILCFSMDSISEPKALLNGHRSRLRERFLKTGFEGFQDYEIIELLLTLATPRRDCKKIAKDVISKFGALRKVLEAGTEELTEVKGVGKLNVFGFKLARELAKTYLEQKVKQEYACRSSKEVFDYLYVSMRDLKKEIFKVLYLNSQNRIIEVEDIFEGSLNSSSVYPREIIKSAMTKHSAALIFAHNHPSGVPSPSDSDKAVTENLVHAGLLMEIKVLDHIVVGDNRYFSFADSGLIKDYEMSGKFGKKI